MNWKFKIYRFFKKILAFKYLKSNMYNLKRRRESVASVYRKTTKFLSSNTGIFLKKSNARKYSFLDRIVREYQNNTDKVNKYEEDIEEDSDLGERDLDYYLGVRNNKETFWRDLDGREQIRKDYLLYHCGVSKEDYEQNYKRSVVSKSFDPIQPRLKQVPFKIHRKHRKVNSFKEGVSESWVEKKGIFKLFGNRRDSDTSDSYSECDSNDDTKDDKDDIIWEMTEKFGGISTIDALNKLLVTNYYRYV